MLVPLLLAACGLTDQQKADYAQVQRSGVNAAVYDKMVHGDDLSLWDIKALSHAGVSNDVVLRYLRNRKTVYYLTGEDIGGLKTAGVSSSIIDYMVQTPQMYATYYPAIGAGFGYFPYYDPFWGPPYPNYPYPYHYRR
ncbi:MAG TPA: hypothetical protein VHY09_01825 [Candidatus Methylacidiphilales bacterium]|nr:hypothetical protein [Candidatus Methylacidiphilales bacterium]